MKSNKKNLNGYIEGYYGRLLSWNERYRILLKLNMNKMNFYFYAPKEDEKHRVLWKLKYDSKWTINFKNFCLMAKKNNVNVIVGISPGFSFNFKEFEKKNKQNKTSKDFNILTQKSQYFLNNGANEIALLFDDLPNNFKNIYGNNFLEGKAHASLTNKLSFVLNKSIFVVPRIYADQLIIEDKNYLLSFGNFINKNNYTFYSGKNIVAKKINQSTIHSISRHIKTKIVIWDNFYSNDYCPRRIFLGPYIGRSEINDIMTNPTGLIETDLLILDIIKKTKNSINPMLDWKKVLVKNKIPIEFFDICKFFLKPDFGESPILNKPTISSKHFASLDFLLWKWKSPLSREWFPHLLGLKHDLLIMMNDFSTERIIKTQTKALGNYLIKS